MKNKYGFDFWLFKYRMNKFFSPVTNWYKNLSVYWSKKEQQLQAGVARTHVGIGAILIKTTDGVNWGKETDSLDDYQGF